MPGDLRPDRPSTRSKPDTQFLQKAERRFLYRQQRGRHPVYGTISRRQAESKFSTRSGPMLVIDGAIYPAVIVDSNDRKPRDGVGLSSPTEVHFGVQPDPLQGRRATAMSLPTV